MINILQLQSLAADIFNATSAQANLITKADSEATLSSLKVGLSPSKKKFFICFYDISFYLFHQE